MLLFYLEVDYIVLLTLLLLIDPPKVNTDGDLTVMAGNPLLVIESLFLAFYIASLILI